MWFTKLTSIPIRHLHGKKMVLFLFYHMRWCTGYGSFLCAFDSRNICIGVDFGFPRRTGPFLLLPFAVSFFDLVFFFGCTYHSYMCLCVGHWQEFLVRGHVCVLLFYAEYHALLEAIDTLELENISTI